MIDILDFNFKLATKIYFWIVPYYDFHLVFNTDRWCWTMDMENFFLFAHLFVEISTKARVLQICLSFLLLATTVFILHIGRKYRCHYHKLQKMCCRCHCLMSIGDWKFSPLNHSCFFSSMENAEFIKLLYECIFVKIWITQAWEYNRILVNKKDIYNALWYPFYSSIFLFQYFKIRIMIK